MINESKIFNNIIGYDNIKTTLLRIIDVLNNQKKYKKIGSTIPNGLLLYGPPGTGKTSIAKEFINNINRKKYIVRKVKSNGRFIDYINDIFKEAKENQPSIILLDDLDKFSENDNKTNNEEYVTIQSLIDDIKNEDIFVIATANNINVLPYSLKRAGRFDIKIEFGNPKDEDAFKIFSHYLKNKKIDQDINIRNLSYILTNCSCAELEKVCNQAGIYAGYKNKDSIGMEELLRAALELKYNTNIEEEKEDKYTIRTAYHEGGHILIREILEPNSVLFATTINVESTTKGLTVYSNNENYSDDIQFMKNTIKSLLAGKAATEIVYHTADTGCNSDLHKVYNIAREIVDNYCAYGFDSWFHFSNETSEKVKESKDDKVNKLISDYYVEVKEILIENRNKLDRIATELKNKKILFKDEIEKLIKC